MRAEPIRIIEGHRREGAHPGVVWMGEPMRPASGREGERFALVLDLGPDAPSRLYREVREVAAQTFWSTRGSVLAALRKAAVAANEALFRHNRQAEARERYRGALCCAALRAEESFAVLVGPACAGALHGGVLELHPGRETPPLGAWPFPDIAVAYIPLQSGTVLLLAAHPLHRWVAPDALQRALARETVEDILDGLEQLTGEDSLTALVVCWGEAAPTPAPMPSPPRASRLAEKIPAPSRRAPAPSPQPPAGAPPIPEEAPSPEKVYSRTTVEEETSEEQRTLYWEPEPIRRAAVSTPGERKAELGKGILAGLGGAVRALAVGARATGRALASVASNLGYGARTLFRRTLPGRERRRAVPRRTYRPPPPENSRRMAAVALSILLLVAVVTAVAWGRYGQDLERSRILSQARQHAQEAQRATDPAVARSHWEAVLAVLGDEDHPDAVALRTEARSALDRMEGVLRVPSVPLVDLGPAFTARRLVTGNGRVFLLEVQPDTRLVRRLSEGKDEILLRDPGLIDIAWNQPVQGITRKALFILSAGGKLWMYDPAWPENPRRVPFVSPPGGNEPVALSTYGDRLYLLDPVANQIWRYIPQEGGEFTRGPEPYFSAVAPRQLSIARDMAIDGNIYVLFADGTLARYLNGVPAPFAVTGIPGTTVQPVALTVDPALTDGPVYLADAAEGRIVVLRATGEFCAQLRPQTGHWEGLQALAMSETGDALYLLAGGHIHRVEIPPLLCR
ncbi:MAG: hypothetical protein N3B68_06450 [Anaerolineae bacterium]|nr:hypothetical protein [Anaerolineae bacterium]